jgi:hypothetical protein
LASRGDLAAVAVIGLLWIHAATLRSMMRI